MKKLLFLTFVVILASCQDGMITFYVEDSTETTIKSSIPINLPFNLPILPVTTTATKEYENNKTTPELIEEVSMDNLKITVISPSNEDVSILKSIHIYIQKSDDTERLEVAYLDNINASDKSIELICKDVNLVKYLREESYKIETKVEVKEYLLHDVDIRIDLKFKVLAKLL